MTPILMALLVSNSFASTDCNQLLLKTSIQLKEAWIENRARFIKGEISEAEYEMMKKALLERESLLNESGLIELDLPIARTKETATEVKQEIKKDSELSYTEMKEVIRLENLPGIIDQFDYDPVSKVGVLVIVAGAKQNNLGIKYLYLSFGDKVSSKPLRTGVNFPRKPAVLGKAKYWPGPDAEMLLRLNNRYVFFDTQGAKHKRLDDDFVQFLNSGFSISGSGNWLLPTYFDEDQDIIIRSTKAPFKPREIIRSGSSGYSDLAMSPNDDYIFAYDLNGFELIDINSSESITVSKSSRIVLGYIGGAISADSKWLYIISLKNEVFFLEIDKLKALIGNQEALNEYIDTAYSTKISTVDYVGLSKFSGDGRYLAFVLKNSKEDCVFVVYDLLLRMDVFRGRVPKEFGDSEVVDFNFTLDHRHLLVYSKNHARVYELSPKKSEAIK